jgi:hypothetical protein
MPIPLLQYRKETSKNRKNLLPLRWIVKNTINNKGTPGEVKARIRLICSNRIAKAPLLPYL